MKASCSVIVSTLERRRRDHATGHIANPPPATCIRAAQARRQEGGRQTAARGERKRWRKTETDAGERERERGKTNKTERQTNKSWRRKTNGSQGSDRKTAMPLDQRHGKAQQTKTEEKKKSIPGICLAPKNVALNTTVIRYEI